MAVHAIRMESAISAPTVPRAFLAVIVHLDMVGYSRMIGLDITGTLERLRAVRGGLIDPLTEHHGGLLVQTGGDSLLLTFGSVMDALGFAVALQREIPRHAVNQSSGQPLRYRIGIDIGEVIADGTDLHGNGVNVATRLQSACPPGGVCISRGVHDLLPDPGPVWFDTIGLLQLKNIPKPTEALVWRTEVQLAPRARSTSLRIEAARVRSGQIVSLAAPSIAVLPFRMLPADAEDTYFADGMVEDIIHMLAAQKEIFVISHGSTLPFTDPDVDRQQVASELGVRYLLIGSVRRDKDRVRIRTELTDTETGNVIRSDQYDGDTVDLFGFQESIGIRVAAIIAPQVRERELRRAMRKPPDSMNAYDLVLQGLDNLYRMEPVRFDRARLLLRRACRLDPDYAPTYSYLAYWHILRFGEGRSANQAADIKAAANAADAALARDANDALALAISGHVQGFMLRDFDRARDVLDRALAAGPNCAMAWSMSSATLGYLNRFDEAVRHAQRGMLLSPLDAHLFWHEGQLAQALYLNGQFEEAIVIAQRVERRNPDLMFNLRVLIASQQAVGRAADARQTVRRMLRVRPDFQLRSYAPNCPFRDETLCVWLDRLQSAGIP